MDTIKIDMFLGQSESKGQIEGEIQLPADKSDIEKVFSVSCNVNVREKNITKDSIQVAGEAEFTVYYISNQGTADSFSAIAPFTHDMDAKGIEQENEVSILCRMEDIGSSIIDPRSVKAVATANFTANVTRKSGVPEMNTDGLQTRRVPVDSKCTEHVEVHPFHITNEMRIPGGMEQVETIVGTQCYGIINGIKKDGQNAICYGDICFNTVYSSKDGLWQINDSFPFEEVIDCDMALENKELIGSISIKKASATAYDPDVISYSVSAVIRLDIMSGMPYGLVVDAYSLTHGIDTQKTHISMKSPMNCDFAKYTFRANTKTGPVEKPVCIMATPYIKSEYAMEGTVNIEGTLMCDIMFLRDDGRLDCTRVQLPMDETVPVPGVKEDFEVWTVPNIQKTSAIITGDDMEIRCLMDIGIIAFKQEEYDIIQNVEEKDPLNRDNSSIMIYFKDEDEDLFDIAKNFHIAMEDINTDNENKLILINPIEC